jgi:hypothetical protein
MIEKISITKYVYWVTLILIINTLLSFVSFIYPDNLFYISYAFASYGVYFSPILALFLIIDLIFGDRENLKMTTLLALCNILLGFIGYYYIYIYYDSIFFL